MKIIATLATVYFSLLLLLFMGAAVIYEFTEFGTPLHNQAFDMVSHAYVLLMVSILMAALIYGIFYELFRKRKGQP